MAEIEHVIGMILERAPEISPWAPGAGRAVVIKVIPETIEAVAVIDSRSHAQTYSIGDPEAAIAEVAYEPSAVARLF
jgi:hypothetical protein